MFAITGVTGRVGSRVATTLLRDGRAVRAVVRDADKGRAWAARGCDVRVADLNDEAAVSAAFTGVDGVFVLLPPVFDPAPGFPEATRTIAALHAALASARPPKVVCLSTIGAQATRPNLLAQLGRLETALASLPMPVTFLRAAWFVENVAGDLETARVDGVLRSHLQPTDRPIPMVSATDVATTAAALLQETWSGRRIVDLEGPRRVAPDDLAASLSKVLGRTVRAEPVPRDAWDAQFRAQGMLHPLPRMQMLDGFNEGWIAFDGESDGSRKGTVDLDDALQALVDASPRR